MNADREAGCNHRRLTVIASTASPFDDHRTEEVECFYCKAMLFVTRYHDGRTETRLMSAKERVLR